MSELVCQQENRREQVRQHRQLNGLDYLEVSEDQHTLNVFFLGKAPTALTVSNVRIEGGTRIQNIRVVEIQLHEFESIEFDDYMEVKLDKTGDFSDYLLRVVQPNPSGDWQPHPNFDARYHSISFNFKVDCPSELDCHQTPICPSEVFDQPDLNYLAKDYSSFRQLILDRLALLMPEWRERHVPDLQIALVEILAYAGDHLSYYQDAVATEAYLDTARQRVSIRRHARLVDYPMHEGCNARTWICIETDSDFQLEAGEYFFTSDLAKNLQGAKSVLLQEDLEPVAANQYEVFESIIQRDFLLYRDHSRILFYTWGNSECCLVRGSTQATLIGTLVDPQSPLPEEPCDKPSEKTHNDSNKKPGKEITQTVQLQKTSITQPASPQLRLKPGDILIFEEVIGAETGHPADANPAHRHAVRLIEVNPAIDPLNNQPIVEVHWATEDALPFPLCISVLGRAPECEILTNVSIACGNVILVDHGKSVDEDLGKVPTGKTHQCCTGPGILADNIIEPGDFSPRLKYYPLTFRQALSTGLPASQQLQQDVRAALPQISLQSIHPVNGKADWKVKRDLLASQPDERHFVAEIDNEGVTSLRFGKGETGRRVEAEAEFHGYYRSGGGPRGNLGRNTIKHLVFKNTLISGAEISLHNPLPAIGGTAPEKIAEVKLFAPHTFRKKLQRAIIAADYAAIVQREFPHKIQQAAARLRWTGSWYEMLVAIDPFGKDQASEQLLTEVTQRLYNYRRIGHDLVVKSACRVALEIEMIVCVSTGFIRGHVKQALMQRLSNRQNSDGELGFFHVDNLTFGEAIYLSQVISIVQATDGVESVQITKFQRLFEKPNQEIENGLLPLGPLEIARLDNDPSFPENGKLTLDMRGAK